MSGIPETEIAALLDLEGAKVETVAVHNRRIVTIDFRHRGTDDGALRIEFSGHDALVIPWNPEVGDFR